MPIAKYGYVKTTVAHGKAPQPLPALSKAGAKGVENILAHARNTVTDYQPALHYIHTDHQNSPLLLTNVNGQIDWRWQRDAFGYKQADNNPDGDNTVVDFNLRFPGQYYDQETGLHYNYYRYYDPSTGRYITSDPIGLNGGLNTFGYVGNNPIGSVDPKGLVKWTGTVGIGKFKIGTKIGKIPLKIGLLKITLDIESECINGKKVVATLVIDDAKNKNGLHFPTIFFLANVEMNDQLAVPSGYALQGGFTIAGKGLGYGSGNISSGAASGSFSGGGIIAGKFNIEGNAKLIRSPKEIDCDCDE